MGDGSKVEGDDPVQVQSIDFPARRNQPCSFVPDDMRKEVQYSR